MILVADPNRDSGGDAVYENTYCAYNSEGMAWLSEADAWSPTPNRLTVVEQLFVSPLATGRRPRIGFVSRLDSALVRPKSQYVND